MTPLRAALAAFALAACLCLSGVAEAGARFTSGAPLYTPAAIHHVHAHWRHQWSPLGARHRLHPWRHAARVSAPAAAPNLADGAPAIFGRAAWGAGAAAWRSGSDLVAEAARYVGSGKFTKPPGAWCADAVSFWLTATGRPPLANRMAASALAYGPHVSNPSPGDLVVMATRRGYAGHVGIVEGVNADGSIAIISGNWGHRVVRGVIPRGVVTAFVQT